MLDKNYYSQLPYALGEKGAMKFEFTTSRKGKMDESDEQKSSNLRNSLIEDLKNSDASFDFNIQINEDRESKRVTKQAHMSWWGGRTKVGELVFVKQDTNKSGFNNILKARIMK